MKKKIEKKTLSHLLTFLLARFYWILRILWKASSNLHNQISFIWLCSSLGIYSRRSFRPSRVYYIFRKFKEYSWLIHLSSFNKAFIHGEKCTSKNNVSQEKNLADPPIRKFNKYWDYLLTTAILFISNTFPPSILCYLVTCLVTVNFFFCKTSKTEHLQSDKITLLPVRCTWINTFKL